MQRVAQIQKTSRLAAVLAMLVLTGCAATPEAPALLASPIAIRSLDQAPDWQDGRARFREIFCSTMRRDGRVLPGETDCDQWLWRLPDEPAPVKDSVADFSSASPAGLRVVLIAGAFAECVGDEALPFSAGAARLRANGGRVETILVSGRSGSTHNARQIADVLAREPIPANENLVLIGYSKGALDALHFLVDFPEQAGQVVALVSVAGPVFGSLIARKFESTYAALLAKIPSEKCPPGDGEVLSSLQPDAVRSWLQSNTLPPAVRYYSLAAFTTREHIARALVPPWKILNDTDPRNDGQVIAADAVIPGSTLLGFANADHWGIAMTMETAHSVISARPDPTPFPLEQLFGAILQIVTEDIRQGN
jgi:pimeloyl-ACP methyl ester carboxylesterase